VPSGKTRLCVAGFRASHNTGHARLLADMIAKKYPDKYETWFHFPAFGAADFYKFVDSLKPKLNEQQSEKFGSRKGWSSPFCWFEDAEGDLDAKGGNDSFCEWALATFPEDEEIKAYAALKPSLTEVVFDKTLGTSQLPQVATAAAPMGIPSIGYHKIRGLGAPLRMMCYYKTQPFLNVCYGADMKEEWFAKDKPILKKKNACINLPYVTCGDDVVTQSNTCLLFIGKKLGFDQTSTEIHNHTVLDQTMDLRNDLMKIVYPFGAVKTKDMFSAAATEHLEKSAFGHFSKLEGFCKGAYMCGQSPQSGDFALFEMLDQHAHIADSLGQATFLDAFPKLKALHTAMKEDPALKTYFSSDSYAMAQNNGLFTHYTGKEADFEYGPTFREQVSF